MHRWILIATLASFPLAGCDSSQPQDPAAATAPAAGAPVPAVDDEFEQLKTVTPVDACSWLTPEKLTAVYPDLTFVVHQELKPQMSGYVWDSRCAYWAGMGTHEFAKDVPTHTVEIFVATSVSAAKANSNLASRQELATTVTGYQPQPGLGDRAYATTNTGVASLFFVKGQSEVQINVSDLESPNDEKLGKAMALAQSL